MTEEGAVMVGMVSERSPKSKRAKITLFYPKRERSLEGDGLKWASEAHLRLFQCGTPRFYLEQAFGVVVVMH